MTLRLLALSLASSHHPHCSLKCHRHTSVKHCSCFLQHVLTCTLTTHRNLLCVVNVRVNASCLIVCELYSYLRNYYYLLYRECPSCLSSRWSWGQTLPSCLYISAWSRRVDHSPSFKCTTTPSSSLYSQLALCLSVLSLTMIPIFPMISVFLWVRYVP